MAVHEVEANNKLVKFTNDIRMEFVRQNMFSPYMSTALNAIIRVQSELKDGGEQMNIPLVTKLRGAGVGSGTLVGNEEKIDNYGMRLWIDWKRNAVAAKKNERHKESADIFGQRKPLLSQWGRELQRDQLIEALMALPSAAEQTGLGSDAGQPVNGILYEGATAAERNTWNAANSDRVLYGNALGNYNATHATALANVDTTNDTFTKDSVGLLKEIAELADPAIHPYMTEDGYEHFVCFAGSNTFRTLKASLETVHKDARERSPKNPLFRPGDLEWDGVIVRKVPQISSYVSNVWSSLLTAGNSSSRVEPVFFCGQQAAVFGWGQMAKPTTRKEDDYGFITGEGIEMAYGVSKMFKKHPMDAATLKQWGVVTGFFSAAPSA